MSEQNEAAAAAAPGKVAFNLLFMVQLHEDDSTFPIQSVVAECMAGSDHAPF